MTSLRGRLWIGFGGLLLILVIVSTLSVVVLTRYSHALQQVFRENYESAVYCDGMKDSIDRLDVAAQRTAFNAPAVPSLDVAAETAQFDENLRRQLRNCTLPGEQQATQELAEQWKRYQEEFRRLETARPALRADVYRLQLLPLFQQLKLMAQRVADMNMANMVSVDGQARGALIGVRNAMLVLVSVGTLLAALVVAAVGTTIVRPLRLLSNYAREIGAGNLDLTVEVKSPDEIARVADAFNLMAVQLRHFRRLDTERLARVQQTTQLAIDSLPDAVLLLDTNGVVEIANRTAADHFGIVPGKSILELRLEWLTHLYVKLRDDPRPYDPEGYRSAIQIFDGGRERFLLPKAVPVLGTDGTTVGITVVMVDVTRLRHADELKSGLLSTVSHELRTPLTSIRMALGLLTGNKLGMAGSPQHKLLTAAREDSDRLHRIIENLLDISRLEAGRSNIRPTRAAPGLIVAAAVDPLRPEFAGKGISLQVNVHNDAPDVWVDPTSIGCALTNLLTNALKFTPVGGEVRVVAAPKAGCVRFTVTDSGPGIPPEFADRIFEKFFRLAPEAQPGAGLGLAIAKEIVEAHQGSISFRPAERGGSEFGFTVRAATEVAASDGLAAASGRI